MGKLNMTPSGVPQLPSLKTPMLTQSSPEVELNQDFMWSEAAFAADMAELSFLAAMTAAPLFWTVGMNSDSSQEVSRPRGWKPPGWSLSSCPLSRRGGLLSSLQGSSARPCLLQRLLPTT